VIADALVLARKDLVLELRRRDVVLGMIQYVVSTLVIVHFAIAGADGSERAAAGMLWAAILFTAILSLNRCFAADIEEGALEALQLAPIDRAAIWLGKVFAQVAYLVAMELVALPAFWLFFFSDDGPAPLPVIAAVLLANLGLATVGVLVAALTQGARASDVLLPVLFLPISIPLVIGAVTATLGAFPDADGALRALGFLALFDTLFALLAWGTFEHLTGE
jgi:heme exporter protein B